MPKESEMAWKVIYKYSLRETNRQQKLILGQSLLNRILLLKYNMIKKIMSKKN